MPTNANTRYLSEVEYEVSGELRRLTLEFDGGPTDFYWNASTARDFYAKRIEQEGGVVRSYGCRGAARAMPAVAEKVRMV